MRLRVVATFLWFVATLATYETIWYFTGAPRTLGPALALTVAILVAADPFRRLWHSNPGPRRWSAPGAAALASPPATEV